MYLTFIRDLNKPKLTNNNYSIDNLFNMEEITITEPKLIRKIETKTVITNSKPHSYNSTLMTTNLSKLQQLTANHTEEGVSQEYKKFFIPKKTGGLREINAPTENLMEDLSTMKDIFQYNLKVLYHNSAYAYIPGRNTIEALKVHQENNSRWFLKLDIKDFFPSCSQEFVVKTLLKIYPFSELTEEELNSFIWLCFKDNQLPQGTPMSPMLTNLIMIPIDYAIQIYCFSKKLCYTRYADDILISGYNKWIWQETIEDIEKIFEEQQAPFRLKKEKTRFGSSAGRNWNLGLMVNKDNNITVGYRKKKIYKAMLNNLFTEESKGELLSSWGREGIYHFQGTTSYYLSVEPDYFTKLINKYEKIYNYTLKDLYKRYL